MKKYLIILAATLIAVSCGHKAEQRIVETYPNGEPMIVQMVKDSVVISETRYYENGNIHYQKHFTKDARREGLWEFNYPNGAKFATADYTKNDTVPDWMIYDHDGSPYYKDAYDSVRVLEIGAGDTPATIAYYQNHRQTHIQLYSNGSLRSMGELIDGKRNGIWTFYHMNGQKQTQATFVDGKEDGQYMVFHPNGVPLYIGHYNQGTRVGTWEYYDEDGTLIKKQDYDK